MSEMINREFLKRQFENYSIKIDGLFSRKADSAKSLVATMDEEFVVTIELISGSGTSLSRQTFDLPLEATVVNGSYDGETKTLTLELKSGDTIPIPIGDLVSGLMSDNVTVAGLSVKENPTADELSEKLSDGLTDIDFSTIFDKEG